MTAPSWVVYLAAAASGVAFFGAFVGMSYPNVGFFALAISGALNAAIATLGFAAPPSPTPSPPGTSGT